MFRWPVQITPFSLGSAGMPREAVLEITPRAAAFTLAALSHVGHAAHLALVDAYLKGQVRLTPTAEIGQDSRTVAASLAAPLIAAAELGVERLTLADLILLPRDLTAAETADRATDGGPTRSPDCARFLLRTGDSWRWVRGAERFEEPGCLGTKQPGVGSVWHDVIVELPATAQLEPGVRDKPWPTPISAEVRAPTMAPAPPDASLVRELLALAYGRFGRSARLVNRTLDDVVANSDQISAEVPVTRVDLLAERIATDQLRIGLGKPTPLPADAGMSLLGLIGRNRPVTSSFRLRDLTVDVALMPELDGYHTLCLLPPADADPATVQQTMLAATRALLVGLIGRPLAEHRSDPIALTLRQDRDGQERITTLDIGESVVIVRNQVVFTAWVGSDGRAMLKLFPPGGMR